MKRLLSILAVSAVLFAVHAENPLGLREYPQKFTVTFPSEQDARNAVLTAKPLPADYKIAFSSRWDDSAISHLKTHAIMRKHGIKGTFFLGNNQWALKKHPDYLVELQKGGCSIGLHTLSHPHLAGLAPNEQFREFMANRIQLETEAQSPVNSQVLPYCNWWAPEPMIPRSVGWAMRATGVISAPDVLYPSRENELGYPVKSLAQSRYIAPGDRNPDLKKLEKLLASALGNKKALAIQPSLSMAMHSWHTPEGLVNLDKAYERVAGNPVWWYCNQNEYGAYRYEAQNTVITKKVNGKNAEFSVTRIQPIELGADVPLWFSVSNAKPVAVSGAKLHGASVELPHAGTQTLPTVFGSTGPDGKSRQIPFATLVLTHPAEKNWSARFATLDGKPVEQLAFTFRFPSPWEKEAIRKDAGTVKDVTVTVDQNSMKKSLYYRYGRPYYAVQADFVRDGKRYRLYADLLENASADLPGTANGAARRFIMPEAADLAALAAASADLSALTPLNVTARQDVGTGVLYAGRVMEKGWKRDAPILTIVDFKPLKPGKMDLILSSAGGGELWMNGKKVAVRNRKAVIEPVAGRNRLLMKSTAGAMHVLILNGLEVPEAEFLRAE